MHDSETGVENPFGFDSEWGVYAADESATVIVYPEGFAKDVIKGAELNGDNKTLMRRGRDGIWREAREAEYGNG